MFEEHYLNITRNFYVEESERLAESMRDDAFGFFKCTRLRIEEETKRAKMILPVSSWGLVQKATEEALWTGRIDWLVNQSEFFALGV